MFIDNFEHICEIKGLKPTPVLNECGISPATATNWVKKRNVVPDGKTIIKLSEHLGVSTDYLLLGKENFASISDDEQELLSYYKKLSEYEKIKLIGRAEFLAEQSEEQQIRQKQIKVNIDIADVAAGAGVSTPFTIDDAFTAHEFPQNAIPDDADCGVPINGDSMEPQYPNGCIAWVKRTETVNCGDVVIAILNGEPYCKIYQQDGLHSYNKNYKTLKIHEQDTFSIFGKVVGYFIE